MEQTVDTLKTYGLQITQPRHGYRFSLDPLLLCEFAPKPDGGSVMDLGTGCGIIPLVMARLAPSAELTGVDHQEYMAELALRNIRENGLDGRVRILHEDVLRLRKLFDVSSFDLVLANPPYRRLGTGKVSPRAGRDLARHESTATLADFLETAKFLVRPGGSICLISHPVRLAELFKLSCELKLAPLRLRMVHGTSEAEARMFLVELAKGRKGDLKVLPPLVVRGADGDYSEEVKRMYREGETTFSSSGPEDGAS
ncbi:tRNA1(Val) (adenine(37)-N6)-methyltransferase [Geobacter sp. DSM 9736]|uniref:tRNA1(Val) (adenine(37)-N6)-methyltransferase n=1 Tax=Geobacter sp. DSM 9736 TaxID=1277350 RepID=UPI000B50D3B6|nr:tRNA1(Val) (adenine(37)-N6)-methyltransferase [Geobacter sp. DSM 9736]SNB46593.1 tRNA1Val (adenine37-N6)-methyltransferase [Geobacter sp. DSM 9736]